MEPWEGPALAHAARQSPPRMPSSSFACPRVPRCLPCSQCFPCSQGPCRNVHPLQVLASATPELHTLQSQCYNSLLWRDQLGTRGLSGRDRTIIQVTKAHTATTLWAVLSQHVAPHWTQGAVASLLVPGAPADQSTRGRSSRDTSSCPSSAATCGHVSSARDTW